MPSYYCYTHPLILAQPPREPLRQADCITLFLPDSEFVAATGMVRSVRTQNQSPRVGERRMRMYRAKPGTAETRKGILFRNSHIRGREHCPEMGDWITRVTPSALEIKKSR